MNRRTFNRLASLGALGAFAGSENLRAERGASPQLAAASPSLGMAQIPARKVEWPTQTYRRLLIDTHVPDWDGLLTQFDAAEYVRTIAGAGFQALGQDANSCAGLCLWQSKVGQPHRGMKGRDYFGEVMAECHRHGIHRVAYYVLVFDDWAYEKNPDWRILPEDGYDSELFTRMAAVCINSPYRDHTFACVRELVGNYEFEGIFIDEPFWPTPCYCPHCTERYWREHNTEPPRIVDWNDPAWRTFQETRERWMLEFLMALTETIKQVRPITVYCNAATMFSPWQVGTSLEQNAASDYCGGDFYGGFTQTSVVCKAYAGLTRVRPFEVMTSRATPSLNDFETTKPLEQLLLETLIPTIHGGSYMLIDAIKPNGTLNPQTYEFMSQINAQHDRYEPFLGGDLVADVAIYYDKGSMYDPEIEKLPAAAASPNIAATHVGPPDRGMAPTPSPKMSLPHLDAVVGAARILRAAHIPFGVITNINLEQLSKYRAVILPNVLEMTPQQSDHFREFVRNGGALYASGASSLNPPGNGERRFLLEDVFGVRHLGSIGQSTTYLSPVDPLLQKAIWPQQNVTFPSPLIQGQSVANGEVLATVTLPFVTPNEGYSIGAHFAQLWNDPPATERGHDPGVVVNTFGKGRAIWSAAPIEAMGEVISDGNLYRTSVYADLFMQLLGKLLEPPYTFEVDTHPAVEMTVFHQEEKHRLLASLLNLQEQRPSIPVGATVRIALPAGRKARRVLLVPEEREIPFEKSGPYIQYSIEPFKIVSMALVEYE